MFDKDLIAKIAMIVGLLASYVFAAFFMIRAKGMDKGFWNITGLIVCIVLVFFSIAGLVGAVIYGAWMVLAILFS